MQAHTRAQTVYEDASDQLSFFGESSLFLHDGREYQPLVRRLQRQVRRARDPLALQSFLHAVEGPMQQRQVGRAGGIAVGIRIELTFGVQIRPAETRHDLRVRQAIERSRYLTCVTDRLEELIESPSLDQRQRILDHAAGNNLIEQLAWRDTLLKVVLARLQAARIAPDVGEQD